MCGISGVVGTEDRALVTAMSNSMQHRGPDGQGCRHNGRAHIGATRLSIMDPASRSVLIPNETETLWVAFNGEIYNHRELRAELEKKGHRFATKTDTEVIVHLYEELGANCVQRLHGMFAFAVMSGQTVFLARDRMGIKPLYYCQIASPSCFVFASEIKALLQCSEVSPR